MITTCTVTSRLANLGQLFSPFLLSSPSFLKIEMSPTRTLFFVFTSILLLFTIFWLTPLISHCSSPILEKALSFFHYRAEDAIFPIPIDQDLGLVDEKEIIVLAEKNFTDFIARNQYVMVMFYAPWCHWSQNLAPEYAAAATLLKGKAVFAKVDTTEEKELAKKYIIHGFPSLNLFVGGSQKVAYYHNRTREAIATWVKQKMEAAKSSLAESVMVLGFVDSLEGQESEELPAFPKPYINASFYQTINVDVVKLLDIDPQIQHPVLVMLKWELASYGCHDLDGDSTRAAIDDFQYRYKFPLVITFNTKEAASYVFNNPSELVCLFAPELSPLISTFQEASDAFVQKLLFVHVENGRNDVGRQISIEFATKNVPGIVAFMGDADAHTYTVLSPMRRLRRTSFEEDQSDSGDGS